MGKKYKYLVQGEKMLKKILTSLLSLTFSLQAEEVKPELELTNYIFMGSKSPISSGWESFTGLNLGLGCKSRYGRHLLDSRASYSVHPAFHIAQGELSYFYADERLKGIYGGVGISFGSLIVQDLRTYGYETVHEIQIAYYKDFLFQIPFTLGWEYEDFSGKNHFIQIQVTLDKFLSIQHGIGF